MPTQETAAPEVKTEYPVRYLCNRRTFDLRIAQGAEAVRDPTAPGRIQHRRVAPKNAQFRDGMCEVGQEAKRLRLDPLEFCLMIEETESFKGTGRTRVWDPVRDPKQKMAWTADLEPLPRRLDAVSEKVRRVAGLPVRNLGAAIPMPPRGARGDAL
jgi:hypothetical protein